MTFRTTIIAAGALIAASAVTAPAAQAGHVNFSLQFATPHASVYFGPGYHRYRGPRWHRQALSPWEIRRLLLNAGFRKVQRLDRRGPIYVARAVAYNGFLYKVRLSARNGRIIAERRVAWVGYRGPRRGRW